MAEQILWLPPTLRASSDIPPQDIIANPNGGTRSSRATKEYVARSGGAFWANYRGKLQVLPRPIDDLDMELGTDKLRLMMMDPQINSSIYLAALAATSRGLRIKPRITDKKDPRYASAVQMQRFVEYNIACLDTSFTETLVDMLVGCLVNGNCVAEQTYDIKEGGEWDGKTVLCSIKPKPPEVYAFLVDQFGNNPALAAYKPSGGVFPRFVPTNQNQQVVYNWGSLTAGDLGKDWRVVPIQKFAVLSNRRRYSDPRGFSALRPAYSAWYLLMQIWPEYIKYLTQFASPSIVGTLPDKAFKEYNDETGEFEDPLDVLYAELLNFGNGTALALKYGATVDLKWSQGDGTAFTNAINALNHQMVKAILHQLLATEEGKHQARAASTTHQDVLNMMVRGLKNNIVSMIQRQIFKQLILLNYGANAAENLTPLCTLGDIAPEDRGDMIQAYAAGGYSIGPSQMPAIDAELELEVRSMEQAESDYGRSNPDPVALAAATKTDPTGKPTSKPTDKTPAKKPVKPKGFLDNLWGRRNITLEDED